MNNTTGKLLIKHLQVNYLNTMEMIISVKIIGAVALFVVTFLFTLLPNKLKSIQESKLKNVSSFCGGLFLGLCFLHLIPDTLSEFKEISELDKLQKSYPMAEFIIICGMILVMTAEKFASIIQLKKENDRNKCDGSKDCCKDKCPVQDEEKRPIIEGRKNSSYVTESHNTTTDSAESIEEEPFFDDLVGTDSKFVGTDSKFRKSRSQSLVSTLSSRQRKTIQMLKIRTFCLVIALMLHSLFEGLTVGLQTNTIGAVVLVALLTFHKCIIGFSLGIALVNAKSDWKTYLKKAGAFAIASPCGVFIGVTICSTNLNILSNEAVAILTAISTGTFIYITFFEILSKCLAGEKTKDLVSYVCFLLGFAMFAAITVVPEMQL